MIQQAKIENYRGFKSFGLRGLARVNLLVGKNNSGKTAVLEAIQTLLTGGSIRHLYEVARRRNEWSAPPTSGRRAFDIAHFFHGHEAKLGTSIRISSDGMRELRLSLAKMRFRKPTVAGETAGSTFGTRRVLFAVHTAGEQRQPRVYYVREDSVVLLPVSASVAVRRAPGRKPKAERSVFVPTSSLDTEDLASVWRDVLARGRKPFVLRALRLLQPEVEGVEAALPTAADLESDRSPGFVLKLKGTTAPLPLGSYGDGMSRVLVLGASLAASINGSWLVDEIDTGLHYSLMPSLWKLVLDRALAKNTQVFATTHSWDCIAGLGATLRRYPELASEVAVHKIDTKLSGSVVFPGGELPVMVQNDIDPR